MNELFIKFLESRDRESYLAVRTALVSSEDYDPYSDELGAVNELLNADRLEDARQRLADSMLPNLMLSPRAHLTMAFIADKSNDETAAKVASSVAAACCEGILTTGDGTQNSPFTVLRTSDEYDVLQYLTRQFQRQSLVHDGQRHFDVVDCGDGSELWFDITDPYNKLRGAFGGDAT